MHPCQAQLTDRATSLIEKLAAHGSEHEAAASPMLWKYVDPDGNEFWLKVKKMSVRSPFSGKSFSAKPKREPPSQLGKDLRDEAKEPAGADGGAGPGGKVQNKRRKKADDELAWKVAAAPLDNVDVVD